VSGGWVVECPPCLGAWALGRLSLVHRVLYPVEGADPSSQRAQWTCVSARPPASASCRVRTASATRKPTEKFRVAYGLSPSWKIVGNLEIAAMRLERDGEVIDAFRKYLAEGGAAVEADVRAQFERDLATLEFSVVRITIDSTPAGVRRRHRRARISELKRSDFDGRPTYSFAVPCAAVSALSLDSSSDLAKDVPPCGHGHDGVVHVLRVERRKTGDEGAR
jgi:hypothetical protein